MLLIPTMLCPKSWEKMSGGETQRFCTHCKKHVHNLEALSVGDRLALLSSPAASVCSRYRVAIRRPARGQKQSYLRHLAKYGAGVAVTGSVLLVLWEMHDEELQQRYYRAAAAQRKCVPMPAHLYVEHQSHLLGDVAVAANHPANARPDPATPVPPPPDLKLDPVPIDRLLNQPKSGILPPSAPASR